MGQWYQDLAVLFNERTGLQYNAGQMRNKFDNLKRDWFSWNRLLQITGRYWNEEKDTVGGSDKWWTTVPAQCCKYKHASPARFRELDSLFGGCIRTAECQYIVPRDPPVHLQFEAQLYGDLLRGETAEISSRPSRRQVRHSVGPSRSSPSALFVNEVTALCMAAREDPEAYH